MVSGSTLLRLMLVALAAAALCSHGPAIAAVGEKARLEKVVSELSGEIDKLEGNPSFAPFIAPARKWTLWFKEQLVSWSPATAEEGRPLREGLELDLKALRRLPSDAQAATAVVGDVTDDLKLKGNFCQRAGLAALVTAKVRTLRRGKEVTGLEVFYIPKLLEPDPPLSPPRFPTLSASEQKLAAGRYVFWTGTLSASRKSTIAVGDGSSETRIDLLVP
jgi:hypothetical protein